MKIIVNDEKSQIELYGKIVMFDMTKFLNQLSGKDTYRITPTRTSPKPLPVTKPYLFEIEENEFILYGRMMVKNYLEEANTIEINQRDYFISPTFEE
jgi:hypothetical protein